MYAGDYVDLLKHSNSLVP